jgi:predicted nucleic acid-binding protein
VIVVDATVVADLLLAKGKIRVAAEALLEEDPEWISTALWRFEFGNVMLNFHRHGKRRIEDPHRRYRLAEGLLVENVGDLRWAEVWRVADLDKLTFYDASYVWMARARELKLRTRDREILRNCPDVALPMPDV